MICICICHCSNIADDRWEPKLCIACSLCSVIDQSANPKHGMPDEPAPEVKLVPLEPISDAQKDKALQEWVSNNGF